MPEEAGHQYNKGTAYSAQVPVVLENIGRT